MAYSLEKLLAELGLEKLPTRWVEFFPALMDDFDKNGCPLLDGKYYERLNREYGMLDGLVDIYRDAAESVKKNEPLARLLHVLAHAEKDRTLFYSELREFKFPRANEGEDPIAYDMLGALAITALADACYDKMSKRGIPQELIDSIMKIPEGATRAHLKKYGRPGYSLFDWNQHAVDAKLFRIGRLQIHLHERFGGYVSVFKNDTGEVVSLADGIRLHRSGHALGAYLFEDEDGSFAGEVTETDDFYIGYPYGKDGLVSPTPVQLSKAKWRMVLSHDDYVIKLHIPSGSPLDDGEVEDSIARAREFVKTYYPDFDYKGFSTYSWLCDPQVTELLGDGANISKFCKRFQPLTVGSNGRSVFRFLFGDPDIKIEDIPETTRLSRALKEHYKSGKAIYDYRGFFF